MAFLSVQLLDATEISLTYKLPEGFLSKPLIGCRVVVPVGKHSRLGIVTDIQEEVEGEIASKIKPVDLILDQEPIITQELIKFCQKVSSYYLYPLGLLLKFSLPEDLRKIPEESYLLLLEDEKLLEIFGKERVVSRKKLLKHLSYYKLKKLEKEGFIKKIYPETFPTHKKTVKLAVLKVPLESIKEELDTKTKELFEAHPLGIETKALDKTFLKKAQKKGWISIEETTIEDYEIQHSGFYQEIDSQIPTRLTKEQKTIIKELEKAVEEGGFKPFLLYGVTGSGKTEIYIKIAEKVLKMGRSVIMLAPEISLITQLFAVLRHRFKEELAVWHSGLSKRIRLNQWYLILKKHKRFVVGTRSAIFSPVSECGLIIVDEEHDPSYKQEDRMRYNARDVAVMRAEKLNIPVILGSATPSLESFYNAKTGKYTILAMTTRIYPGHHEVTVVDMRREKHPRVISTKLKEAIRETIKEGFQALLFLNRRGYSNYALCRRCGYVCYCTRCSIPLTYHIERNNLQCHYCNFEMSFPEVCPNCQGSVLLKVGFGTEKVEEEILKIFPSVRALRIDTDAILNTKDLVNKLNSIRRKEVEIVIGTQMIAKGHNFPLISLIGIVNADSTLSIPDFRAGEITVQQLFQVGGRSGRSEITSGKIIVQTYNPNHYIIESFLKGDYQLFCERELASRRALGYPPYFKMTRIVCESPNQDLVHKVSLEVGEILRSFSKEVGSFSLMGPAPSPFFRLRNRNRWHLILRTKDEETMTRILKSFKRHPRTRLLERKVHIIIDRDPIFCL